MSTLPPSEAETTEAFLAGAGPSLATQCTACGACFDACPMADFLQLRAASSRAVTEGLRRLAVGEAASADTVKWVGACTRSGLCVSACPERQAGLNAMLLVRIAKQRAINTTRQLPAKPDPTAFPRLKVYARLQLSDEELKKWL